MRIPSLDAQVARTPRPAVGGWSLSRCPLLLFPNRTAALATMRSRRPSPTLPLLPSPFRRIVKAHKVYRGVANVRVPDTFLTEDRYLIMGGVGPRRDQNHP